MNKQANILFTGSSFESRSVSFNGSLVTNTYSHTIYGLLARASYTQAGRRFLGRQLIFAAEHALTFKQTKAAEQIVQVMQGLEVSNQFQGIARYYEAMCSCRRGDLDGAIRTAELAVETATPAYRARALQCIGGSYHDQGRVDEATSFFVAAGKAAAGCDALALIQSRKMLAVVRSIRGDHKRALDDLENLSPLTRLMAKQHPAVYFDYLNSLAVELGEVGRIHEAHQTLSIALASPFASAYQEWSETKSELEAKRVAATSSVVAITHAPLVATPAKTRDQKAERHAILQRVRALAATRRPIFASSSNKSRLAAPTPKPKPCPLTTILACVGDSIKPRAPPSRI